MTTALPVHPGEHLAEILAELGISPYRLAKAIGVPPVRIHDIVHCRRSITADTGSENRSGVGNDSRILAEPSAMDDLDVARSSTEHQQHRDSRRLQHVNQRLSVGTPLFWLMTLTVRLDDLLTPESGAGCGRG